MAYKELIKNFNRIRDSMSMVSRAEKSIQIKVLALTMMSIVALKAGWMIT